MADVAEDLQEHTDRATAPRLEAPRAARVFWGRVARVHLDGDPLKYKNKKTGEWEPQYRDADELAKLVPLLPGLKVVAPPKEAVHHPAEMLLDAQGEPTRVPHRVIGQILESKLDDRGEYALAKILIDDPYTLKAIDDGVRELSLGYWSRLDGKRFQRKTRPDHLSVVPVARCGEDCQLRADSMDAGDDANGENYCAMLEVIDQSITDEDCGCGAVRQASPCRCKSHAVNTAGMDELQKQLEAAKAEVTAMKARLDASEAHASQAEKDRDAARVEANNAKKDLDAETARADAADKAIEDAKVQANKDAQEQLQAHVDARVELLTDATAIVGKTLKSKDADGKDVEQPLSKMNDREIMTAVVKHVDGDDIDAKETIDYVKGMYAGARGRAQRSTQSRQGVRQTVQANRDAAPKRSTAKQAQHDEAEALAKMNKLSANRYRTGR